MHKYIKPTYVVSTIPTSPVLDTFDRANASTLGSSWSLMADYFGGIGDQAIVSNTAYNDAATFANYSSMYWNAQTYGPDCEVYLTLSTRPSNANDNPAIYLRMSGMGLAATNSGYLLSAILDNNTIAIQRLDNGSATTLGAAVSQTLSSGDKIRLVAVGSNLYGYVYRSSAWSLVLSRSDSTYTDAGYLAMYFPGSSVNGRFNDFGGGTLNT